MTKQYSRFLTVVFSIFLAGLLIWHIVLPDRDKSETENRTLAQFPEFSWEAESEGMLELLFEESVLFSGHQSCLWLSFINSSVLICCWTDRI